MKISQAIAQLQELQKAHGDVDIYVFDVEEVEEDYFVGVEPQLLVQRNHEDKVVSVTVCDKHCKDNVEHE